MSTARRTSQTITAPSNNTNRRRSSTNSTYSTDSVDLVFDNINNVGASKTPSTNKSIIEHPLSNTTPLIHNNIQTHISPNRISPKYHPASTAKKKSTNNTNTNSSSPPRSRRKSSRRGSNNSSSKLSASSTASSSTHQQTTKKKLLLPRSIRWRISLNLLNTPLPSSTDFPSSTDHSSSTTNNNNNKEEKEKLYKSIEEINALKIRCQRSHYDELEKLHYWKSTPTAIASSDEGGRDTYHYSAGKASVAGGREQQTNDLHHRHVSLGDDPLSSLLQRKKSNEFNTTTTDGNDKPKEKWGGIFGNKNRDRTKSKDNLQQRISAELERTQNKQNEENKTNESACKGSRWAEYYSTREVLDVIEKDLDRLPNDHYLIYHEYRMKKFDVGAIGDDDGEEDDRFDGDERVGESKKMAAKRTSWKVGKSGIKKKVYSNENFANMLEESYNEEQTKLQQEQNEQDEIQLSIKERSNRISQLLFVYARDHSEIGYRQGMHEVLSYILLAIEMDLLNLARTAYRKQMRKSQTSFGFTNNTSKNEREGSMAGVDDKGNMVVVKLLDPDYILHDAYNLFECIMTALAPAYDVIPVGDEEAAAAMMDNNEVTTTSGGEEKESPMEIMTASIISKIRFIARDEQLFGLVLYMPVPPTLYFAKWIRLLFSREVDGGMKKVMCLWDAFFDLASARSTVAAASNDNDVPIPIAVLDVLKAAAAGMILLIRDQLLAPCAMTGEPDPNNGIAYLMNYPPIDDIQPLIELISDLLAKEKKLSKQYQVSKERKLDKQYLPTESYTSVQMNSSRSVMRPALTSSVFQDNVYKSYVRKNSEQSAESSPDVLPKVYRPGQTPARKQRPAAEEIVESVGHIATEVLDFGSKTASAAIASIQKQYENHRAAVDIVAIDHPLQDSSSQAPPPSAQHGDDYIITYRADASIGSKSTNKASSSGPLDTSDRTEKTDGSELVEQFVDRSFIDRSHKSEEDDLVEELFSAGVDDSPFDAEVSIDKFNDSISSQRFNDSMKFGDSVRSSSKVSSVAKSVHKSPKELSKMLEKSVDVLMNHFNEKLNADADADGTSRGGHPSSSEVVPEEIWNALAEIDRVKKELIQQDAINSLDAFRSSGVSNLSNGSGSARDETEQLRALGVKHPATPRSKSWLLENDPHPSAGRTGQRRG